MWNETESQVVHVKKILLHNGVSGAALAGKFRSAAREDVRLAAALMGYFEDAEATDGEKEQYFAYLSRRIRPAVAVLIEENRVPEMEMLEKAGLFTPEMVDEFLETAIGMHRSEAIVWLLRRKDAVYGYRDHDFRL